MITNYKLFEDIYQIKKYVVWKSTKSKDSYIILELIGYGSRRQSFNSDTKMVQIKMKCLCSPNEEVYTNYSTILEHDVSDVKKKTIYQSDSLEECLEKIKFFYVTDKYNL